MDGDWARAPVLDLGAAMPPVDGLAIGRYDEERAIYTAPEFQTPDGRWRTRHMAVDLFAPAGAPVYAPLDGVVERAREPGSAAATTAGCWCCATATSGRCTGISTRESLASGEVRAGEVIARLGAPEVNGGWEPHLHLQLFTDLVGDLPGRRAAATRPTSGAASARTRTCCSGCPAAWPRGRRGRTSPRAAGR